VEVTHRWFLSDGGKKGQQASSDVTGARLTLWRRPLTGLEFFDISLNANGVENILDFFVAQQRGIPQL
jgi:hypothetical protein